MPERIHLLREQELAQRVGDTVFAALQETFDALARDKDVDPADAKRLRARIEEAVGRNLDIKVPERSTAGSNQESLRVETDLAEEDLDRGPLGSEEANLRVDRHRIVEELKGLM